MARPKDRAERMAIVAGMERKEKAKRLSRNLAIGLVVILVLAGAVYGLTKIPGPAKIVHWHAKYQVWVDDQKLNFDNPVFNDHSMNYGGALYLPAHLHQPSDIIHNEGKEGDGTMGKFFKYDLGGDLSNSAIKIPNGVLGAAVGVHAVDANHTLALFVDKTTFADQKNATAPKSNWIRQNDIGAYSFHDGDRILLLYGDTSAERIAQLEAQFPTFDPKTIT